MMGNNCFTAQLVRHALEQRKVAEIRVRQQALQAFQFFREIIEFPRHLLNAAADRPVVVLGKAALHQRQIAEAEQIQRRIERLLRIVKAFEQILRA